VIRFVRGSYFSLEILLRGRVHGSHTLMKRLKTQKDFVFLPEIRNLPKKVCLVES
jgi:hypothetical protein